jgi:D-arabinose 1-dehydrogenase-like Zn-dependent alcohol dehydrogenase
MAVAATQTVLIPENLPAELAAPVLCAGYTSWCALRAANPLPHERVAVLGIGALGHLALQYATARGHETVAITSSPDKHSLINTLGTDIIVATGQELREAGGADVVVVTGSSYPAAADSLQGLRPGGRLVLAGIDPSGPLTIPPALAFPFFALGIQIIGATHNGLSYLREALDLVATGQVTPMVEVFTKDQLAEAVDKVGKGEARFRAVVTY